MALMQWTDNFSVKVAEIDQQHQTLVGMINELNAAMKVGKGREAVGGIIDRLVAYTATHFSTEEKFFKRFGYPETAAHQKEHADFVKKVTDFQDGFQSGKLSLTIEVMTFLSDWLKSHILGTDKQYVPFFQDKGLK